MLTSYLLKLSVFPQLTPFLDAFAATGDYTPLLAMCDRMDELDFDHEFEWMSRDIRFVLFPPVEN